MQIQVRSFRESDRERLREITIKAFNGVSIDQNIERLFGLIGGKRWYERKIKDIENDCDANPEGVFVAELNGKVVGYITTRVNQETKIGRIVNFAVMPEHQGKGIGTRLMNTALKYLKDKKMELVRIETLEQNEICKRYYPKLGFREVARQIYYAMRIT